MLRMLVRWQARQRRSWTRELRDRAAMRYAGTLAALRERAVGSRRGYQTLINSEKTGLLGGTDVIGADRLDGEAYGGARGPQRIPGRVEG